MKLTKERLQQIVHAAGLEPCDYEEVFDSITTGEIVMMARQLLAGMEQEPVYQVLSGDAWVDLSKGAMESQARVGATVRTLYAAPQLPKPAVPDFDALRLAFEATERKSDNGFNLHKYGIGYADKPTQTRWEQWVSCRAAMLQGAEPVTDNTNQQFESLSRGQ